MVLVQPVDLSPDRSLAWFPDSAQARLTMILRRRAFQQVDDLRQPGQDGVVFAEHQEMAAGVLRMACGQLDDREACLGLSRAGSVGAEEGDLLKGLRPGIFG